MPDYVLLTTTMGEILLELDRERAPISAANFLEYVKSGFYEGTIFHRVIGNFMIQGGGFTPDMEQKKSGKPIKNEWKNGLTNALGTVAMARLGNQPDSASSQFFINVAENRFLDEPRDGAGYAVFGKVVAGLNVVNQMKAAKTGTKAGHQDVPREPITISSAQVLTKDEAHARMHPKKQPAG